MKKLFVFFMLLTLCSPAFCAVQPPQWSEFCPPEYVNASYIDDNTQPNWICNLCAISLIGLPYASIEQSKKQKIKMNNYWVQRKNEFYNSLNCCNNMNDNDKYYSYLSISQAQYNKNNELKLAEIQRTANQARIQANRAASNASYYQNYSYPRF